MPDKERQVSWSGVASFLHENISNLYIVNELINPTSRRVEPRDSPWTWQGPETSLNCSHFVYVRRIQVGPTKGAWFSNYQTLVEKVRQSIWHFLWFVCVCVLYHPSATRTCSRGDGHRPKNRKTVGGDSTWRRWGVSVDGGLEERAITDDTAVCCWPRNRLWPFRINCGQCYTHSSHRPITVYTTVFSYCGLFNLLLGSRSLNLNISGNNWYFFFIFMRIIEEDLDSKLPKLHWNIILGQRVIKL